jgi:hypothetical protein
MSIVVQGTNGTVTFNGRAVTIDRAGATAVMSGMSRGSRTIPLANIAAVQLKPVTMLTRGYIAFVHAASDQAGRGMMMTSGNHPARNPDAVLFGKKQEAEFQRLRDEINRAIGA